MPIVENRQSSASFNFLSLAVDVLHRSRARDTTFLGDTGPVRTVRRASGFVKTCVFGGRWHNHHGDDRIVAKVGS